MSAVTTHWEHFEHEADTGVRGIAPTLEGAMAQAAVALTAVVTEPEAVAEQACIEIRCEEADPELLLVDWLNAVIYEMATRRMLFARFELHLDGPCLSARAWGELVDASRHRPAVEVKGATYTALSIHRGEDGAWVAQCVVDV